MKRRTAISLLGAVCALPISQLVRAQAAINDVAWCFWHEGVRLYDDGFPGTIRDVNALRSECLAKQQHNAGAYQSINATSNDVLVGIFAQVESFTQKNFNISENFAWTAHHEGAIKDYRTWIANNNYGAIRGRYEALQAHNPNAHYLLSATSNGNIKTMVDAD